MIFCLRSRVGLARPAIFLFLVILGRFSSSFGAIRLGEIVAFLMVGFLSSVIIRFAILILVFGAVVRKTAAAGLVVPPVLVLTGSFGVVLSKRLEMSSKQRLHIFFAIGNNRFFHYGFIN